MKLYSQRDPRWAKHPLGWGPALGTIGQYGCFVTSLAMIVNDTGLIVSPYGYVETPATLDEFLTDKRIFTIDPQGGTMDLLPDRALDLAFPGRFQTIAYPGYRADLINKALPSKHSYAVLWISTMSVPTHFVIAYSLNAATIADPWTGLAGYLSGYGGPGAVHKTLVVTYIPPVPVTASTAPVVPPVVTPPGVPPTPVVVIAPQPIPCPTPAPPVGMSDRLAALLQAFVIAIIRVFQGG